MIETEVAPASSVFARHTDSALRGYLKVCQGVRDFDAEAAYRYAVGALAYYKGDGKARDAQVGCMKLEQRWYDSLARGEPDYSVYGEDVYMGDVWACWAIYSRRYLLDLRSPKPLAGNMTLLRAIGPVRNAVDLGCGFGYTTAALKEIFPAADVYGTNLKGTLQFDLASAVGQQHGFQVVPSVHEIGQLRIDLVFASEYFEHFLRPVEHLIDILKCVRPRVLIMANAFGARSTGHFNVYKHGQSLISNKKVGRFFAKALRAYGYAPLKTKLWNNRPAYWMLRGANQGSHRLPGESGHTVPPNSGRAGERSSRPGA
jgi:SAM-dependent methyltransferase